MAFHNVDIQYCLNYSIFTIHIALNFLLLVNSLISLHVRDTFILLNSGEKGLLSIGTETLPI